MRTGFSTTIKKKKKNSVYSRKDKRTKKKATKIGRTGWLKQKQ